MFENDSDPTLTEMIQGIFAKSFLFRVNATTNDNTPGKNAEARLCKPKTKTILAKRFIRYVEFLVKQTTR